MLPDQIPPAPVDMVMTPHYDLIMGSSALILLWVVLRAFQDLRRSGSAIPLLILSGAALTSLTECVYDVLSAAWWPQYGHTPFYRIFNVSVPIWMLLAYPWYYGGIAVVVYKTIRQGMTRTQLWRLYWLGWLGNFLVEIPALQFPEFGLGHVYSYYGDQPFQIFHFPLWMAMTNALVPILMGALVAAFEEFLTGVRSLLTLVLVPMGMAAAQGCAGWPVWLALHSGQGYAVTNAAALVTLGLSLLIAHLVGLKFCVSESTTPRSSTLAAEIPR